MRVGVCVCIGLVVASVRVGESRIRVRRGVNKDRCSFRPGSGSKVCSI